MEKTLVKVAVLMAARNGLEYLPAQIESILNQKSCMVKLFVSDDLSTDGSLDFIEKCVKSNNNVVLLPNVFSFGSAAKNFYRLILDANINQFDFIAFADQDDIWDSDKLIRHVEIARQHSADGVSSNVTAFWPNGREKLIDKAQPQTELDYLSESAGPGCTFLMSPWLVNKVREQLLDESSLAKKVALHDWLTYAVCRAHGGKWIIDTEPSVMYRQHQSNLVGANSGFKAKMTRLKKLKKGWYRGEVIKVCEVSASISANVEISRLLALLRNKNIISQYKILPYALKARRKFADRLLLIMSIVLFVF